MQFFFLIFLFYTFSSCIVSILFIYQYLTDTRLKYTETIFQEKMESNGILQCIGGGGSLYSSMIDEFH